MNKEQFMDYLKENFDLCGSSYRLISNILDYVALQGFDEGEQHRHLCMLLDGTIGLSESEIAKISL